MDVSTVPFLADVTSVSIVGPAGAEISGLEGAGRLVTLANLGATLHGLGRCSALRILQTTAIPAELHQLVELEHIDVRGAGAVSVDQLPPCVAVLKAGCLTPPRAPLVGTLTVQELTLPMGSVQDIPWGCLAVTTLVCVAEPIDTLTISGSASMRHLMLQAEPGVLCCIDHLLVQHTPSLESITCGEQRGCLRIGHATLVCEALTHLELSCVSLTSCPLER